MNNQSSNTVFERYLTVEEEKHLFNTVDQFGDVLARRDAAWMRLLRHTGIRVGTMAKLTVMDAKLAVKTKRLVLRNEICKGKKGYAVHANTSAVKALKKLLKIREEMGYRNIADSPLVMSRNHKAMSVRSYQERLNIWRKKAELQIELTPHFFRHTTAQRIMESSTAVNPLLIVKAALGHASINSSAIYSQPNREQVVSDMEAIS